MGARKVKAEPATAREVRQWANENGFNVGERGRLKTEVKEAFTAKTKRPLAGV